MRYIMFLFIIFNIFSTPAANAYKCTAASEYMIPIPTVYASPYINGLYEKIGDLYTVANKPLVTCTDTSNIRTLQIVFFPKGYNYPNDEGPEGNLIYLGNVNDNSGIIYNVGVRSSCGVDQWMKPNAGSTMELCGDLTASFAPKVQFFQKNTGQTITSNIMQTQLGVFWVKINGAIAYSIAANFSAFNVVASPCQVTNRVISVPMGDISKGRFSGVLTTAGGADFNISLQCTQSTPITVQIDGSGTSPNRILGLIPIDNVAGAATGVAIQLLNNSNNKALITGSANALGTAIAGNNTFNLRATYMQIDDNIEPGTANGSATFTIRYN